MNKFLINNIFAHPDLDVDFMKLAENMTQDEFMEFLESYEKSLSFVMKDPFKHGIQLERELIEWYKRVFFSVVKPLPKTKPNLRLIYRYDLDFKDFYILAVAVRNAKTLDSVYHIVKNRDKTKWIKQ